MKCQDFTPLLPRHQFIPRQAVYPNFISFLLVCGCNLRTTFPVQTEGKSALSLLMMGTDNLGYKYCVKRLHRFLFVRQNNSPVRPLTSHRPIPFRLPSRSTIQQCHLALMFLYRVLLVRRVASEWSYYGLSGNRLDQISVIGKVG